MSLREDGHAAVDWAADYLERVGIKHLKLVASRAEARHDLTRGEAGALRE